MKPTIRLLCLLSFTTALGSGPALSADTASAASASGTPAASKGYVRPHNHMRDAKGVWVKDKRDRSASASKPASAAEGKPDEASTSKKVTPHSHPRDAKGMSLPSKPASKPASAGSTDSGGKPQ